MCNTQTVSTAIKHIGVAISLMTIAIQDGEENMFETLKKTPISAIKRALNKKQER